MKHKLIFFFSLLNTLVTFSQGDSILLCVDKFAPLDKKVDYLVNTVNLNLPQNKTLSYLNTAYYLSKKSNDDLLISKSLNGIAYYYYNIGSIDSSRFYNSIVVEKLKKSGYKKELFNAYYLRSILLSIQKNFKEEFEIDTRLLDLADKFDDETFKLRSNIRMAALFMSTNDFNKAINYLEKSLKISLKLNSNEEILQCYQLLGNSNLSLNLTDLAMEYYERGLKLSEQANNQRYERQFLISIGSLYYQLYNDKEALKYFTKALKFNDNKQTDINLCNNIGISLVNLERYKEAKPYLIEAYYNSRNSPKDKEKMLIASYNLAEVYEQLGDYKSAMDYIDIYINLNDSLNNVQNTKNLSEIEAKYQNEKKEKQNEILNERLKSKSMQMYFALGSILLLCGLVFFVIRGLKQKQRANFKLEEKNKIIEEKSLIVEDQHNDIKSSIKYAERIQQAILPPDKLWKSILPKSFLLYQPRDVLSGDFYWVEETTEYIFVAAADCTGHGVPGALMSIVNYNLLNRAVLEKGLTKAGEILDNVNEWLTLSLHQTFQESTVRDGMDLSLCVINKKTKELNFAGAFNSIYILRNNTIEELIPDKQPVGAFIEDSIKPFTNRYTTLTNNDVVYMFTDGYADQFGGEKGKKFKYKNLQNLLLDIHQLPFDEQKTLAAKRISDWKGNLEQVDDILLIGFQLV